MQNKKKNMRNDLYKFDVLNNFWTKVNSKGNPPSARSGMKSVCVDELGKIYFFGGYINKDSYHCNDLFFFDILEESWTQVKENPETHQENSNKNIYGYFFSNKHLHNKYFFFLSS